MQSPALQFEDDEAVQCTGALAVMALIRGDGPASSANKRRLAEAGGIEAVASALTVHRQSAMVQLSCMLCLVPLALEGSEMQVRIASTVIPHVLHALQRHSKEPEVVAKALVLLGVLAQVRGWDGGFARGRQGRAGQVVVGLS